MIKNLDQKSYNEMIETVKEARKFEGDTTVTITYTMDLINEECRVDAIIEYPEYGIMETDFLELYTGQSYGITYNKAQETYREVKNKIKRWKDGEDITVQYRKNIER